MGIHKRFFDKVLKTNNCWLWLASIGTEGYGGIRYKGEWRYAHRVSWELHNGKIPDGKQINHKCQNRLCVNPDHLYCGTQKDNVRDSILAGRHNWVPGEKHTSAKLTEEQVREIRNKYIPKIYHYEMLAKEYGVSLGQICGIVKRRYWKHIE